VAGRVLYEKVLSTPPAYDRAVVDAARRLGSQATESAALRRLAEVVHGTTVATNAVLERRGARTAAVTTAGFRDVLEFRRRPRVSPDAHAASLRLFLDEAAAARPTATALEAAERTDATRHVLEALDEDDVLRVVARLCAAEVGRRIPPARPPLSGARATRRGDHPARTCPPPGLPVERDPAARSRNTSGPRRRR
jgi:N-methylhydantoinase A